jgi:lipopolysaccharide export system protein LptA
MAVTVVMAQKKSVINLISSKSIQGVKIDGVDMLKVYGGTFQQDFSTLTSDSAYFHQAQNTFDAFGHVLITQGDTMHIYSDKLNYNGNTKIAILTDNVRMVDKDATLTTNYLTYNTATKFGTYTGGGKLVNKDNTLTSQNGYYYANSRDSYFRYNVVLVTPDALTKTDTMRYNTGSRISYFYGPTHIYGKKSGKDNDTLYTENGNYNTVTEQAFFGKKNLYSQGTKTLKGDSMFYDRKKGYGRVVKNITFNDEEQKMTLKGNLGTFYKADERTVVTENAYLVIITEEKDTTKNDSVPNKPDIKKPANTKKLTGDTVKSPSQGKAITLQNKQTQVNKPDDKAKNTVKPAAANGSAKGKQDSITNKEKNKPGTKTRLPDSLKLKNDTARIKHDSVFMTADTLETRILTFKDLKDIQEKIRLSHIKDTTIRPPSIVYKKPVKFIELSAPKWIQDSTYLHRNMLGKPTAPPVVQKKPEKPAAPVKKISKQDSIKLANKVDSVYLTRKVVLSDTARIRILSGSHNVKLFKSDLQGKSDSAFYSTADSTIRLYVNPIIWTQGSQLTGDTINLQMKNKKFNNLEAFPNSFMVNVEKTDSTHFNQGAGKKMRGFFNNNKLERMFIDGNAETIYFSRDSGKISGMQRSLSSRIKINFKDGKVTHIVFISKPEHKYGPLDKFTEEDKVLKGFIWKPKERPLSKESIIHPVKVIAVKIDKTKPPVGKATTGKDTTGKDTTGKDTTGVKAGNPATPTVKPTAKNSTVSPTKTGKDTTVAKPGNPAVPTIKPAAKDSTLSPATKNGKDTSAVKPGNLPLPPAKSVKDTTLKQPANQPPLKVGKDSTGTAKPPARQ